MSDKILGIKKSKIRKAYFSKDLKSVLNEIQSSEEMTGNKMKELDEYLSSIKEEDSKYSKKLAEMFGGDYVENKKLPSVEELQGDVSKLSDEWASKQEQAEIWINNQWEKIKQSQTGEAKIASNFWLDLSTNLIILQGTLDKIRVFYDQQYRARLTLIKEDYGITRKEAEEYAKLTSEYRDYKNAILQRERIEEMIVNARRHDQKMNYR